MYSRNEYICKITNGRNSFEGDSISIEHFLQTRGYRISLHDSISIEHFLQTRGYRISLQRIVLINVQTKGNIEQN
jgi:hypothetical protein